MRWLQTDQHLIFHIVSYLILAQVGWYVLHLWQLFSYLFRDSVTHSSSGEPITPMTLFIPYIILISINICVCVWFHILYTCDRSRPPFFLCAITMSWTELSDAFYLGEKMWFKSLQAYQACQQTILNFWSWRSGFDALFCDGDYFYSSSSSSSLWVQNMHGTGSDRQMQIWVEMHRRASPGQLMGIPSCSFLAKC